MPFRFLIVAVLTAPALVNGTESILAPIPVEMLRRWTAISNQERVQVKRVLRAWLGIQGDLDLRLVPDNGGDALLEGLALNMNFEATWGNPGMLVQLQERPWVGFLVPTIRVNNEDGVAMNQDGVLFGGSGAIAMREGLGLERLIRGIMAHSNFREKIAYLGVTGPAVNGSGTMILVTEVSRQKARVVYQAECYWRGGWGLESCEDFKERFLVAVIGGKALVAPVWASDKGKNFAAEPSSEGLSIEPILSVHFKRDSGDSYDGQPLRRMAPVALDDL
ncbi:MAG: hypothetical protein HY921_04320 [Elusimicrobia bacterium]|nr:hypothetical protein [Elusimicrobiota bacterium]